MHFYQFEIYSHNYYMYFTVLFNYNRQIYCVEGHTEQLHEITNKHDEAEPDSSDITQENDIRSIKVTSLTNDKDQVIPKAGINLFKRAGQNTKQESQTGQEVKQRRMV